MRRYTLIAIMLTLSFTAGWDRSHITPTAGPASAHAAGSPDVVIQLNQALQFATNGTHLLIIWQRLEAPPTYIPILGAYMQVNDILAGVPSDVLLTPAVAGDLMGIRDQAQMALVILINFPSSPLRGSTIAQVNLAIDTTTGLLGG